MNKQNVLTRTLNDNFELIAITYKIIDLSNYL